MSGMWSKQMASGKWWVLGYRDFGPMGPYDTKAEAEEKRRGLERTLRYMDEPGFISTEPVREKTDETVA